MQRAGLQVERHNARLRPRAALRGRQHVVRDGLCAVLFLRLLLLHSGQLPLLDVHAYDQRCMLCLHCRRQLVRGRRHCLHTMHSVPGRNKEERRGLHDDGRRDVHKLHGGPVLGGTRRHGVHGMPHDGGHLLLARPRGPVKVRMQYREHLRVEHGQQHVRAAVHQRHELELDGPRTVLELRDGIVHDRQLPNVHADGRHYVRRLRCANLFTCQ